MDKFDFYWYMGEYYLLRKDEKLPQWLSKYCPETDDRMEFLVDRYNGDISVKVTYLEYDEADQIRELESITHELTEEEQVDIRCVLAS